jgi:hypothetical protein
VAKLAPHEPVLRSVTLREGIAKLANSPTRKNAKRGVATDTSAILSVTCASATANAGSGGLTSSRTASISN